MASNFFDETFIVKEEIGHGAFGKIHLGYNRLRKKPVAIKFESNTTLQNHLKNEYTIYSGLEGISGIPRVYFYGYKSQSNVMVMDLLGESLADLITKAPDSKFSLKTFIMLFDQMITLVQLIHERGIIHRNLHPSNFLLGIHENSNQLFLIDFGIAKCYLDPSTEEHIPYQVGKEFLGSSQFVSINTHMGLEQSRRDDLEALGYVMIFLMKGTLPWLGITSNRRDLLNEQILESKLLTSYESLCEGLPKEFVDYFKIVRSLQFEDEPPYEYIKDMFQNLFIRQNFVYDYKYDWVADQESPTKKSKIKDKSKSRNSVHNQLIGNKNLAEVEQQISRISKRFQSLALPPLYSNKNENEEPVKDERILIPKAVKQKRIMSSMTCDMIVNNMCRKNIKNYKP